MSIILFAKFFVVPEYDTVVRVRSKTIIILRYLIKYFTKYLLVYKVNVYLHVYIVKSAM